MTPEFTTYGRCPTWTGSARSSSPEHELVLVGGGYIGLEIAAVAAGLGLAVTVLEAQPTVLARVTCPAVARFFEDIHRRAGVTIRCATTVTCIEDNSSSARVVLDSGEYIDADLVVVLIIIILVVL
jgi:3-phenylpropionate/trans-cinnamate dioxygenase ferredoxin reductase subunit